MKILITDVFSGQDVLHVRFHSPVGGGIALWNGSAPKTGETVDVEYDLDEVFSWGKNIMPSSEKTSKINVIADTIYIIAELTPSADRTCAALNLCDSIILIELEGPIPLKSGFVEVRAARIHLYPTNI
jgi:hypothetical protein